MNIRIFTAAALIAMTAALSAQAADYTRSVYLADSSFEDGVYGWSSETTGGGSVLTKDWGCEGGGECALGLWTETPEQSAQVYKRLTGLAPGTYVFSAYVCGGGSGAGCMYAKTSAGSEENSVYKDSYAKQSVTIDVPDDGALEIGFKAANGVGLWYNADETSLVCTKERAADGGFIQNSGFENSAEGFVLNGAQVTENGREGSCLRLSEGASASVTAEKLESGFYAAEVYVKSDNADSVITAVSDGYTAIARIPVSDEWKRVVLTDAYTENGALEITVQSGGELYIDDLCLKKAASYRGFITGGDITEARYMEDKGAKYYYADGTEGDCVKILADNGVDTARVRVYNSVGKDAAVKMDYGSYYLPDGYQTAEDALKMCARAKQNGMRTELTFHYSDFWTNGEQQFIPGDWKKLIEGKTDDEAVSILEEQVYKYTKDVMTRLKEQGTLPELVSVGNEIQCGMLYPYGYVGDGESKANWKYLARFLNAGSRAVREVSPSSRVIIHLDDCGNYYKYEDFFGECAKNGVDYDIIGASYYPFWSKKTIEHTTEFCNYITDMFDKDIIIMETGYNFYPYRNKEHKFPGQLEDNGPYEDIYPATQEGHKRFMADLFNGLKQAPRCLGDLYWDPVMIDCSGAGWAVDASTDKTCDNVIPNSALFDFIDNPGRAIESLAVFADTRGASYSADITVDSMRGRFDAREQNGRIYIKNLSDKDENIAVFDAQYTDGVLSGVKLNRLVVKAGENVDFEKGGRTFVWTQDSITPVTYCTKQTKGEENKN